MLQVDGEKREEVESGGVVFDDCVRLCVYVFRVCVCGVVGVIRGG